MKQETIRYGSAIIAGAIVMILFALVTINVMKLIPLAGPFVGGLVAGLIVGKDFINGGKAAALAGWVGAVVVSLDFMLNTGYFPTAVPIPASAGIFFLIVAIFYFPILAFIGGAAGGIIRR